MKKFISILFLAGLLISFASCSTESKVEKEAVIYLKNQMKFPDSFKTQSVEVILDTVPVYLNENVQSALKKHSDTMKEWLRYSSMGDLFFDEKVSAMRQYEDARDALPKIVEEAKGDVQYIVLISYMAKNGLGAETDGRAIVIVDKENLKVLGVISLDDAMEALMEYRYFIKLKPFQKNQYGKYETEDMDKIEAFVMVED